MTAQKKEKELNFEESLGRLEEILEKMNSGGTSLEDSLQLFEEADGLIVKCHKRLTDAERKIETLIKNRNGELELGADGKPLTQEIVR